MRLMKTAIPLFLGAVLYVTACGQSVDTNNKTVQSEGKSTPAPLKITTAEEAQQRRLHWNLDTLVGDYERHGHHNPLQQDPSKKPFLSGDRVRI